MCNFECRVKNCEKCRYGQWLKYEEEMEQCDLCKDWWHTDDLIQDQGSVLCVMCN